MIWGSAFSGSGIDTTTYLRACIYESAGQGRRRPNRHFITIVTNTDMDNLITIVIAIFIHLSYRSRTTRSNGPDCLFSPNSL